MRSINILRIVFIIFLIANGVGSMGLGIYLFDKLDLSYFGIGVMFMFCIVLPFIFFGAAKCFVHMVLNNEL